MRPGGFWGDGVGWIKTLKNMGMLTKKTLRVDGANMTNQHPIDHLKKVIIIYIYMKNIGNS